MRVTALCSGSLGNSTLLESGATKILIDCGLNSKQLTARMAQVGVKPEELTSILLTHSHGDHTSALRVMTKKFPLPIYATGGAQDEVNLEGKDWRTIQGGKTYDIGNLQIEPFSVPHDAEEPVGFLVRNSETTYGHATDLGHVTLLVQERLKEANIVLLESNYDREMLTGSSTRPWHIRQRTASRLGHLQNEACAEALTKIVNEKTRHILLGHLSRSYNLPELAEKAAREALEAQGMAIPITVINPESTTPTTL